MNVIKPPLLRLMLLVIVDFGPCLLDGDTLSNNRFSSLSKYSARTSILWRSFTPGAERMSLNAQCGTPTTGQKPILLRRSRLEARARED